MATRARYTLLVPFVLTLFTLSLFLLQLANPAGVSAAPLDQAVCEAPAGLNGTWDSGAKTCTIATGRTGTIPSGTTVDVYNLYHLAVESGATLNVYGTLGLWAGRLDLYGTANVQSGGVIDCRGDEANANHGGSEVYGTLNVNSGGQYIMYGGTTRGGFMDINATGVVNNHGNIETYSPADWFIDGSLLNYATVIVRGPADVTLYGAFENYSGANLYIYGQITGMPYEVLRNYSGAHIYLYKTAVDDQGLLYLSNGFVFQNQGTIDVNINCHVTIQGSFNNEGTIFNYGQWDTSNKLTNSYTGVFHNYGSVALEYAFDNYGQMDGYGSWDLKYDLEGHNYRTLSMTGGVALSQGFDLVNGVTGTMSIGYQVTTGTGGGSIQNYGQLDLNSGARINLNSSSYLQNHSGGVVDHYGWVTSTISILNDGTYYKHCGAVLSAPGVQGTPLIDLCVGTIRIFKSAVGGDGVFDYTGQGTGLPATFAIATSSGSGSRTDTNLTAQKRYTVTEAAESGWIFTSLNCVDSDGGTTTSGSTAYIDLDEGQTITCTFTNTADGHLIVQKETLPDGDSTWFPFIFPAFGSSLHDGMSFTAQVRPGTYYVTETVVSGWMTPTITCSDADSTGSGYNATYRIAAGEWVTCTFTNAKKARLTVDKAVVPSPNETLFHFDYPGVSMNLGESDLVNLTNLAPGTHRVTETVTSGWRLTNLSCTDANTYLSGTTAVYQLEPGEWVTCTFTNELLGHINLCKETVPDGNSTLFSFEGSFSADLGDNQCTTDHLLAGAHFYTETAKTGWMAPQIVCSDSDSVGSGYSVEYRLDPGEWVTCTFTNVMGPDLAIRKSVEPAQALPGGALTYTLSYWNHGQFTSTLATVSDVLPPGVTVDSWSSSGPSATMTSSTSPLAWQIGALAPSASGSITLYARAPQECVREQRMVTNTATISGTVGEANTADNSYLNGFNLLTSVYATPRFTSSNASGCVPLTVYFTDTSTAGTAPIAAWFWSFGDGSSSTERNTAHTYTTGGQFRVSLRITDTFGCVSELNVETGVSAHKATAAFTPSVSQGCAPLNVTFTNQSTAVPGTVAAWRWDFGDGSQSTAWSPAHTYACPGTYQVTLVVTDSHGCSNVTSHSVTADGCLVAAKLDRFDPVPATSRIEYEIAVRNTSPYTYDRVVITDTLPAGTYFLGMVSANAGWHDAGNRVVTRTVTSLLPNQAVYFMLTAGTHSTARGPVTNQIAAQWGCVFAYGSQTTVINPPVVEPTPVPTATPTPAPGGQAVIIQTGAGCDNPDTYVYRYQPDANYSLGPLLRVGYRQNFGSLLRFDLSEIPAGVTIESARLELYAAGWSGADITLGAHAVSNTVTISETTWSQPQSGWWWGLGGANDLLVDRRQEPETTLTTTGPLQWYALDLSGLVQEWVLGLPNNGVLLRQSVYSSNSVLFASAEYSNASLRPRLVVSWH